MPTPKGKEFIKLMLDGLLTSVEKNVAEQIWINNKLAHEHVFQLCRNRQQCHRTLEEVRPQARAPRWHTTSVWALSMAVGPAAALPLGPAARARRRLLRTGWASVRRPPYTSGAA